jgi:hypothetical protein
VLAATTVFACGCDGAAEDAADVLQRRGRFGSMRDLVLLERSVAAGGPFFLDRFEVTRGDWHEFATDDAAAAQLPAGPPPSSAEEVLPVAGVTLAQARAFARWRFCRLPRSEEWEYATTADRRYQFPWGDGVEASRANTGELGLGEPTPVGTFEVGQGSDNLYDLVGNVAEWTESVPIGWFVPPVEAPVPPTERWRLGESGFWMHVPSAFGRTVLLMPRLEMLPLAEALPVPRLGGDLHEAALARWQVGRWSSLSIWRLPGSIVSPALAAQFAPAGAPREIVGAHFAAPMYEKELRRRAPAAERRPAEQADTIGFRLCASPAELLAALWHYPADLTPTERLQLERFVARGNNRDVLRRSLPAHMAAAADHGSPAARLLAAELRQ